MSEQLDLFHLILTGLLVLVTAMTFGAIWWQARETARAAKATETAANAAAKGAEIAEKTLYLTQAADVHIDRIPVQPLGPLTPSSTIIVVLKNFGQTRANKITQDLTFGIPGNPTPPKSELGVPLGAGQTFQLSFPCTQALLTQSQAQGVPLKVWGEIMYSDVFGKQHTISCEGTYDPNGPNWIVNQYEITDEASPEGE